MQISIFLLMAAAAGVMMALQGSLNGAMGKIVGMLEGNFIVHVIALAAVAILLFVWGLGKGDLHRIREIPWYLYLGGLINVAIIYAVMFSIAKVGAGPATTAILVGQILMSLIIDSFGLFGLEKLPFTWYRIAGVALMGGGAWLIFCK